MPYSGDPSFSVIDRVRLTVGDTLPDPILDDTTYQFLLDKYENNETRAAIEAAQMILFSLARYTRERAGDIEVYGADYFRNYSQALKDWLSNPNLNNSIASAMPYAGGISVADMKANADNTDNVEKRTWHGFSENDSKVYPPLREDTFEGW